MVFLKYKKTALSMVIICCGWMLQGCVRSPENSFTGKSYANNPLPSQPEVATQEQRGTSSPYAAPPGNIIINRENSNDRERWLTPGNTCIRQLDSLKKFAPSDYKIMVNDFKKISEINAIYRSVQNTATNDVLLLLKMNIESKTELLCARVRYISVMAVSSALKKLDE